MAKCGRFSSRVFHARRNRPESPLLRGFVLAFTIFLGMVMQDSFAGPARPSGSLVPTRSEVIATQGMAAGDLASVTA